jgi:hypothetical protein
VCLNDIYINYFNVKKREERRVRGMMTGRKNDKGRNGIWEKEETDKSIKVYVTNEGMYH